MSSGDGESKSKSRIKYKPDMELALAKIISQTKAYKKDDNKKVAEKLLLLRNLQQNMNYLRIIDQQEKH